MENIMLNFLKDLLSIILGTKKNSETMSQPLPSAVLNSPQPTVTVSPVKSIQASVTDFPSEFEKAVYEDFKKHIILREGEVRVNMNHVKRRQYSIDDIGKHIVYEDSLGKPTVGWGHLVLKKDNLKVGDLIDDQRAEEFFKKDSAKALRAAYKQAKELGHGQNKDFIVVLGSVNYQLGTAWPKTFKNTYKALKEKKYDSAILKLRASLWNRQTPVRVQDFIEAIEKLKKGA